MKFNDHTTLEVHKPHQQGSGAFDNGKITEIKPLDFPGGSSLAKRVGPLFYWAWASAKGDGVIGMHPHRAFEIVSYVLEGEIGHTDSLRNKSRVGEGGAQVMQTGSGVYHQEEMYGERTEFFQIWLEPNLQESIKKDPTYNQFEHGDFQIKEKDGGLVKSILGPNSQVMLDANVTMEDITIEAGATYQRQLGADSCLAVMTVDGDGRWFDAGSGNEANIGRRDFTLIKAEKASHVKLEAGESALRIVAIEVPQTVDYQLY